MNVAFVNLFLGLVVGPQEVQVAVGGPVTAVELRLDGAFVARLGPPAWKEPVDFGPVPLPHDLEAVGLDAEGNEAGRVPTLRADLRFGNNVSAAAEAFLGSHGRDYTSAELTAVAVLLTGRKDLPPPEGLSGWFVADGKPLGVVAAEEGPADVVFLVDPGVEERLGNIARQGHWRPVSGRDRKRLNFRLEEDHLVWFVLPAPKPTEKTRYTVFPLAGPYSRSDGGLLWLYFKSPVYQRMEPDADALGRAATLTGTAAIQQGRRRAVVWILPSEAPAASPELEAGRRYLKALNVPLFVWRVSRHGRPSPAPEGDLDASTPDALDAAISGLEKALDRQRIVWVEGNPLPQNIVLTPTATGIALAR